MEPYRSKLSIETLRKIHSLNDSDSRNQKLSKLKVYDFENHKKSQKKNRNINSKNSKKLRDEIKLLPH